MESKESRNHIWIQEVCFKSPFDQHHFVLNIQNLHWTSWTHLKSWNYGDSRIMESYFNPWSLLQKSLWPAPLCVKYAEFALNFINTFEIMKLLRLKNHRIKFKSMKFTSKVIMKLLCGRHFVFIEYVCQRLKVVMDAPVSPQDQNNNHENKYLKMISMAKYVGASHWPQGKSVAESNHPN